MKKIIISIVIVLFVIACTADGAWDFLSNQADIFQALNNYDNRIKVTINNSSQDENLTNFPVLVILNTSKVTYSTISADGSGIKFISSDFTKELSYEVEEWNPGGDSFFWVKIPSITALSNSEYFWIYLSTESNTNSTNSTDVWSNNYLAVWHMNDTDGTMKDSSTSGLDGIADFMGGPGPVTGTIAGAQNFTNNAAKVTITPSTALDNLSQGTYSFWMFDNGYNDQDIILKKGSFEIKLLNTETIDFFVNYDGGSDLEIAFDSSWAAAVWRSFHLTWTGGSGFNTIDIFADGLELTASSIHTNGNGNRISDTGVDLIIGNDSLNAHSFLGLLDEIRISGFVRSPAWIKAQYLSMTDTFLTYETEEEVP